MHGHPNQKTSVHENSERMRARRWRSWGTPGDGARKSHSRVAASASAESKLSSTILRQHTKPPTTPSVSMSAPSAEATLHLRGCVAARGGVWE